MEPAYTLFPLLIRLLVPIDGSVHSNETWIPDSILRKKKNMSMCIPDMAEGMYNLCKKSLLFIKISTRKCVEEILFNSSKNPI